mmetsp:Transcript_137125/g.437567  ORF Transcript_137125/g.437567 Transcript_137125/m.437567 type:complete len:258 (-) Transcript_137125:114-887(-)
MVVEVNPLLRIAPDCTPRLRQVCLGLLQLHIVRYRRSLLVLGHKLSIALSVAPKDAHKVLVLTPSAICRQTRDPDFLLTARRIGQRRPHLLSILRRFADRDDDVTRTDGELRLSAIPLLRSMARHSLDRNDPALRDVLQVQTEFLTSSPSQPGHKHEALVFGLHRFHQILLAVGVDKNRENVFATMVRATLDDLCLLQRILERPLPGVEDRRAVGHRFGKKFFNDALHLLELWHVARHARHALRFPPRLPYEPSIEF